MVKSCFKSDRFFTTKLLIGVIFDPVLDTRNERNVPKIVSIRVNQSYFFKAYDTPGKKKYLEIPMPVKNGRHHENRDVKLPSQLQ